MKKNKLLYFLIASVCTLTSCNSNSHTEKPLGAKPIISADGKTIIYGLYPQSHVSDSFTIANLNLLPSPEENGWYLYEGKYYTKTIVEEIKLTFDDGAIAMAGETYWFRCEPIVWDILSNANGKYYIVSSVLLDQHSYYDESSNRTIDGQTIYPNNYKYSDIRAWLNEDFYNSAFALGNEYIQTTIVDNSASTTESTSNNYACDNTEDKVFLPSYQDYLNSEYGFSTSWDKTDTRWCRTTDWARARGASYAGASSSDIYVYNGYYCTRSPNSDYGFVVCYVTGDGSLFDNHTVYGYDASVRPAITITID